MVIISGDLNIPFIITRSPEKILMECLYYNHNTFIKLVWLQKKKTNNKTRKNTHSSINIINKDEMKMFNECFKMPA